MAEYERPRVSGVKGKPIPKMHFQNAFQFLRCQFEKRTRGLWVAWTVLKMVPVVHGAAWNILGYRGWPGAAQRLGPAHFCSADGE